VVREENRIDILIKNEKTKHCIIIENKIKHDTRLLPRSYLIQKGTKKYAIDGIIYVSMDGNKRPNKETWTVDDHKLGLDAIITYCAASNGTDDDLVNGFLKQCLLATKNVDEEAFLRQYITLLEFLRRSYMDYQQMKEFYELVKDSETYKTALSIRPMLDALRTFRRDKGLELFM
jgi:hypothetical protein